MIFVLVLSAYLLALAYGLGYLHGRDHYRPKGHKVFGPIIRKRENGNGTVPPKA